MIRLAIEVASSKSFTDLPIAAVVIDSAGEIVGSSRNCVVARGQVTAHAELLAISGIDMATLKENGRELSMAVTLEPCPMCAWAIRSAGIGRLVFGAYNPNYGAAGSVFDLLRDPRFGRSVEVIGGVLEEECRILLGDAFIFMRNNRAR